MVVDRANPLGWPLIGVATDVAAVEIEVGAREVSNAYNVDPCVLVHDILDVAAYPPIRPLG